MLVNVLSWRRVHYWHPFVNVFKDNRWTWKMYVCIYVQQYAYACVWNVGLMYVHVYVTAPQSKWSSPHFIWWHHRANEGSLFMPLPHFKPCFQALFLQIHNWLHHWRGSPYLWASVCRYCIYRPYGVSTLCKVCKKLRVPELLKQHSIEKHKHRAHPPWVKQIVLSQFKRSWVICTNGKHCEWLWKKWSLI